MGLLDSVLRGASNRSGAAIIERYFGDDSSQRTEAGEVVTVEKALGLPAVYAAIRTRADLIGTLPLMTYRRGGDGSRERADDDPRFALLHDRPNPEMTAAECWGLVSTHLNAWGQAFVGKDFGPRGVTALWPIQPDRVRLERRGGQRIFWVRDAEGRESSYTGQQIIHIKLFSLDGFCGISPLALERQAVGMGIALQKHAARFFADSAIPSGAITVQEEIKKAESRDRLRAEWEKVHRGRRRTAVLDSGAKYEPISIPMRDAQFVELAGLVVQDIARIFRLPPSTIGGSKGDSLTYSNQEMDGIQLLVYHLQPELAKIEQALNADVDLFPQGRRIFAEFLVDGLLRADIRSRYEAYATALAGRPFMHPSEVRERENLPPDQTFDQEVANGAPSGAGHPAGN